VGGDADAGGAARGAEALRAAAAGVDEEVVAVRSGAAAPGAERAAMALQQRLEDGSTGLRVVLDGVRQFDVLRRVRAAQRGRPADA